MPRLNSRGQAVSGASGVVSVDGGPQLAVGWVAQWLDDDRIIYSNDRVESLDLRNGEVTVLHGRGANNLSANGGKWVGWNPIDGLFGDVQLPFAGTSPPYADGRGAVGRDGTLAYVQNRQAGIPTVLRTPDGDETLIHAATYGLQVLGPHSAIWTGGALNAPQPPQDAISPKVCGDYLVYFKDGLGLVAHLIGTNQGKILTREAAFNHDAVELDGDVIAAWSRTQGEGPHDLVKVKASDFPLVDLEQSQPDPPTIQPFPRPIWWVPHYSQGIQFNNGHDDMLPEEGMFNAYMAVEREAPHLPGGFDPSYLDRDLERIIRHGVPLVVDQSNRTVDPRYWHLIVSNWVGRGGFDELGDTVRRSLDLTPHMPIIAYLDRPQEWPEHKPDWVTRRVWPSVQTYPNPGESTADTKRRCEVWLDRIAGWCEWFALAPAFYTRNGAIPVAQAEAMMPVYDDWMRRYNICFVEPFAGLRRFGMREHPSLGKWNKAFAAACVRPQRDDYWVPDGTQPDPPEDPPHPPEDPEEPPVGLSVEILDHPRHYARNDPKGLRVQWDITSDRPIRRVVFRMVDDGDDAFERRYEGPKDGRYTRGEFFKVSRSGKFFPQVTVYDDQNVSARATSHNDVNVTDSGQPEPDPDPDPEPEIPPALHDQSALVAQLRRDLFPELVAPDGSFLPMNDMEKAAKWAQHLAWHLRGYGIGLARAKPGSGNHGGATPQYPEGFTTDVVALASGVHWDFQIDSGAGAYPTWAMEDDPANYPPIAERWVAAFQP